VSVADLTTTNVMSSPCGAEPAKVSTSSNNRVAYRLCRCPRPAGCCRVQAPQPVEFALRVPLSVTPSVVNDEPACRPNCKLLLVQRGLSEKTKRLPDSARDRDQLPLPSR